MRQKTSRWFEVKFAYDKAMENGEYKKVTELYVVGALSFAEAEAKIVNELVAFVLGDCDIKAITIPQYKEIWFSDKAEDDKFFKLKLQFVTVDEKTMKEKKTNFFYLVQAKSFDLAKKYTEDVMSNTMMDYTVVSLKETAIMDVFE